METKLIRIAQIAKERPKERITSLAGLINKESLTESHRIISLVSVGIWIANREPSHRFFFHLPLHKQQP